MRDQDFFWEGVDNGQLLAQSCSDCQQLRHPPAPMCPHCLSLQWAPQALSGQGNVCTFMISAHPSQPDANPRIVALVDLPEGIRMVTNLVDIDIGDVETGMPVELVFRLVGEQTLPQFCPAQGARI